MDLFQAQHFHELFVTVQAGDDDNV
jgi:hypothetical protein